MSVLDAFRAAFRAVADVPPEAARGHINAITARAKQLGLPGDPAKLEALINRAGSDDDLRAAVAAGLESVDARASRTVAKSKIAAEDAGMAAAQAARDGTADPSLLWAKVSEDRRAPIPRGRGRSAPVSTAELTDRVKAYIAADQKVLKAQEALDQAAGKKGAAGIASPTKIAELKAEKQKAVAERTDLNKDILKGFESVYNRNVANGRIPAGMSLRDFKQQVGADILGEVGGDASRGYPNIPHGSGDAISKMLTGQNLRGGKSGSGGGGPKASLDVATEGVDPLSASIEAKGQTGPGEALAVADEMTQREMARMGYDKRNLGRGNAPSNPVRELSEQEGIVERKARKAEEQGLNPDALLQRFMAEAKLTVEGPEPGKAGRMDYAQRGIEGPMTPPLPNRPAEFTPADNLLFSMVPVRRQPGRVEPLIGDINALADQPQPAVRSAPEGTQLTLDDILRELQAGGAR